MPPVSHFVTPAEFSILKALWAHGEQSARSLAARLYSTHSATEVATVHSLLQRLEKKKLVHRDRSGQVHRFTAAVTAEDVACQELEIVADRLLSGKFIPFVAHLLDRGKLSRDDIRELRTLLNRRRDRDK